MIELLTYGTKARGALPFLFAVAKSTNSGGPTAVEQAVHLYDTRRPHTALGYRFPAQVYAEGLPPAPLRDAR